MLDISTLSLMDISVVLSVAAIVPMLINKTNENNKNLAIILIILLLSYHFTNINQKSLIKYI